DERIVWLKAREAFIHSQALVVFAPLRVVVAQQLQRVHVFGITLDDALHELDLHIQLPRFLAGWLLLSRTAFNRHTTPYDCKARSSVKLRDEIIRGWLLVPQIGPKRRRLCPEITFT